MTELRFLITLLLEHKLQPTTKKLIAERIEEVEKNLGPQSVAQIPQLRPAATAQSPSTQAILDRSPLEPFTGILDQLAPSTPLVVAQTPATAMALAARQESIRIATSGKEEKGRSSPRKF
jgi:hypothetical protein